MCVVKVVRRARTRGSFHLSVPNTQKPHSPPPLPPLQDAARQWRQLQAHRLTAIGEARHAGGGAATAAAKARGVRIEEDAQAARSRGPRLERLGLDR